MPTVSVRYIVNDIDAAISFYCDRLGFHEEMHPNGFFAMLAREDLRLRPQPARWRSWRWPGSARWPATRAWRSEPISIELADLDAFAAGLHADGVPFRTDIIVGVGGKQLVIEDPSGNPVELFEPTIDEARLTGRP